MEKSKYMKCPRCGSTMMCDNFSGPNERFWGWNCLLCGEIIDPIILDNRQLIRSGRGMDVRRDAYAVPWQRDESTRP